ncbi:hypothetical protein ACLB2K_077240 [Fragaria x ananassa]
MAESIARGVVRSGILPPNRITTSHSSPLRRQAFEYVISHAVKDVVLQLMPSLSTNKLLVSIAAGLKLKDLQKTIAAHYCFLFAHAFVH